MPLVLSMGPGPILVPLGSPKSKWEVSLFWDLQPLVGFHVKQKLEGIYLGLQLIRKGRADPLPHTHTNTSDGGPLLMIFIHCSISQLWGGIESPKKYVYHQKSTRCSQQILTMFEPKVNGSGRSPSLGLCGVSGPLGWRQLQLAVMGLAVTTARPSARPSPLRLDRAP